MRNLLSVSGHTNNRNKVTALLLTPNVTGVTLESNLLV